MAYVGKVGERREFFLKVVKTYAFQNRFGYTYLNSCLDRWGNVFVYKGSSSWKKDHFYRVVARVNEHALYQEVEQTHITRPSIVKVVGPEGNEVTV